MEKRKRKKESIRRKSRERRNDELSYALDIIMTKEGRYSHLFTSSREKYLYGTDTLHEKRTRQSGTKNKVEYQGTHFCFRIIFLRILPYK